MLKPRLTRFAFACVAMLIARASVGAADRPNILFAIADDASYPYMGAYGCSWVKSPGFDRVAKEGLLFTHAYTPNAKCAPSRACIITGRNSWQLEAAANHWCYFPEKFKSYVEALGEHGYFVGKTGKGWAPGVAEIDGKPRQLVGTPFEKQRAKPPTTGINSDDYAANFNDFLDAAPKDQPWCFWYGSTEPHRGYEYGSGIAKGGMKTSDIDHVPAFWPDNETVRTDMLDYAFELEHFDKHLVRMLDELDKRGLLANTIVVVTADNGMPFPRVKGQEYEMSNHLPLAIMWPKGIAKPGRVIDDYVSFIDFAPTFIEAAGLSWAQTGMADSPGRSLFDIFRSESAGIVNPSRDHVLIGKERHDVGRPHDVGYPIRGIVKGGVLYIQNFETDRWPAGNPETGYLNCDGSPTKTVILEGRTNPQTHKYWEWSFGKRQNEEMFKVDTDRECQLNVSSDPGAKAVKEALSSQMMTELKAQGDPRMFGQGYVFDQYPCASKGEKDFYERYMSGEKIRAGWVNPSDFEKTPIQ
ncbi:MAG: sulfatase-like hydrolase/transferase [Planctomycetes bacterium]|nr:sulfatase-like hydrolase/transferase [Planctomycetota bacterium]